MNTNYITIEFCINCSSHKTHTRHNEAKYKDYASTLRNSLTSSIPGLIVLENAIPINWKVFKIYNNLWDIKDDIYILEPKIGSFEVSNEGNVFLT